MFTAILLCQLLPAVCVWLLIDVENDMGRRRIIFAKRGQCLQTRAVQEHQAHGRLYPVEFQVPGIAAARAKVWMCYAHAFEWNGAMP